MTIGLDDFLEGLSDSQLEHTLEKAAGILKCRREEPKALIWAVEDDSAVIHCSCDYMKAATKLMERATKNNEHPNMKTAYRQLHLVPMWVPESEVKEWVDD